MRFYVAPNPISPDGPTSTSVDTALPLTAHAGTDAELIARPALLIASGTTDLGHEVRASCENASGEHLQPRKSANISDKQLGAGRAYRGGEWLNAILRSIYGPEQTLSGQCEHDDLRSCSNRAL